MAIALLIARLVLCVLFAVAGVAKLADRAGSRAALAGFGVGRFLSPLLLLLPLAELAAAALLLADATARWGALVALMLLAAFTVALATARARGQTPDCHCFGRLRSTPAGRVALGRNTVLTGLAAFVVIAGWREPGASAVGWLSHLSAAGEVALASGAALMLLAAFGGAVVVSLLRQHGRLLLRVSELEAALSHELPVSMVPAADARSGAGLVFPDLSGRHVDLGELRGRETLLLFWDPGCGFCADMLPRLRRWEEEAPEDAPRLLVISSGAPEATRELGLRSPILLDPEFSAAPAFRASGTPSAVLLDEHGRVASDVAAGADEVLDLLVARVAMVAAVSA